MRYFALVCAVLAATVSATQVSQCENGKIENLSKNVQIGNCNKPPCRLRKNTKIPLSFKFQAGPEIKSLTQQVNANIVGIPFPFVGVDGTSVCDKIYEEDGTTKNNCQFEKGKTYVYKNEIDVLQIYPRIKTVVHWALADTSSGKNAICFEVPARITN
ncbi:NPC intracellular cholesterol transporter 2 [Sitophilus oryzae]|uniref:NPC intracellular cholesterol transporter 2 n=1 Tax=Sitophilus oryzae TaxID=7048 RepID=A0A6J2YLQ1_SITOR|nr:NPC intracellular cholesterol transporter 2 [Sitophilus oryzae]